MAYPSLRGQEHLAQEFLYQTLDDRGYEMDRWAIDVDEISSHPGFSPVKVDYTNAINVVATHHPESAIGRSLILKDTSTSCLLDRRLCGIRHLSSQPLTVIGYMVGVVPT
ncbi:MAG: hypothetical protein CM1200mP41_01610 [Gammaproteobacteria bacterium]|nr:MAG: hypothetical protein CM1200mP41_01610 [Gammaproteobacteria bacterium]